MTGSVLRLNVSGGGVPKSAVAAAQLGPMGLSGDDHDDRVHHGGPERALCIYSRARLEVLRAEGHPVEPGGMGENITLDGLDTADMVPGDRLEIGRTEVEISGYATPCRTIAGNFIDGGFSRVLHDRHPGDSRLYARVLRGGEVRQGDPVRVTAVRQP
ncbi:MAG: MOSC domain-containing protein [Candidatus Dormibacteria bacterium]